MMQLIKDTPFITADAVGMNRICRAIAARRIAEANILPALPREASSVQVPRLSKTAKWVGAAILIIHLAFWAVAWGLNTFTQP